MLTLVLGTLLGARLAVGQTPLAALCRELASRDPMVAGDGARGFDALCAVAEVAPERAERVLVIVEERLWGARLDQPMRRYLADLAAEGLGADLVTATLVVPPPDAARRDGRALLALRELVRAVAALRPGLRGVVLVGHFPDALLVRTVSWRKRDRVVTGRGTEREHDWGDVPFLRRVPEIVAHRCDLVLGDLDGAWPECYVEAVMPLPTVVAVFDGPPPEPAGGTALAVEVGSIERSDCFLVADGRCTVEGLDVVLDDADRDHECTAADRERGNPLARAEVFVSRIDARGIALYSEVAADGPPAWRPDAELELRLLADYFERNHRYRTEPAGAAFRPASIAHGLGSGFGIVRRGAPEWADFTADGYDAMRGVDLVEVARWLQRGATLRTLRAHSDGLHAAFAAAPDPTAAARGLLGGDAGAAFVESVRRGRADYAYWRGLWEGSAAGDAPFILLHTGCEALSPPGSGTLSYLDPRYGRFAQAESILFFTRAVAIVGRAKVFYDEPGGFVEALGAGATVGDALRRYGELESMAASWSEVGGDIGRKRSYFWSVVGDATLRLRAR
ncbi:MAG: hypothetical protein IPM29_05375 [Planctomycetes bacterium]|nr:hypothetical protein [Planctomycetota bacterium]